MKSLLIKLKAANGKYLSSANATETIPLNTVSGELGEKEEFWLMMTDSRLKSGDRVSLMTNQLIIETNGYQRFTHDLYIVPIDYRGHPSNRLYTRPILSPLNTNEKINEIVVIHRLNNDGKELADGDRIALKFVRDGISSFLSADTQIREQEVPSEQETFTIELTRELKLYWNEQRLDNFSTATRQGQLAAENAGYSFVREQGRIFMNKGTGRKPLYLFWHSGRGDNFITTSENDSIGEGEREAIAEGYTKVRCEGFILTKPEKDTIPLRTYWKGAERNDYFSTTRVSEEQAAADAGYGFIREEGFILPYQKFIGNVGFNLGSTQALTNLKQNNLLDLQINPDIFRNNRPRRVRQPDKKALVLSGGGAKGCFEVGAVQRLWEQGYRPDIICGVSVGALNAVKLAEKKETSAIELKEIWQQLRPEAQGGKAIYSENYFVDLLGELVPKMLEDGVDDRFNIDLGKFAKDYAALISDWIKFAGTHLHAIHSMHPLRKLISQHLNINAIRESGVQLRIGMTDLKSGQYFSVTEPFEAIALGLNMCGRIEVEPDHRIGENWLTRPILAADSYAMSIEDAVYSSCVLPVFMDTKMLNLRRTTVLPWQNERIALLSRTYSPPTIDRLMRLLNNGERKLDDEVYLRLKDRTSIDFDLNPILQDSFNVRRGDSCQAQHHIFDGGLRDTMAIRTAIRLGAREIIVITGDRLQTAQWNFKNPGLMKEDMEALPAAQYLFGLLGIWFNEAARTDVLLAVAQNEFLGWLYRCFSLMSEDKRQQIIREFNEYSKKHGSVLRDVLGGSTWIGGDTSRDYGVPFQDEGCCIKYISPSGELVDALGFNDWDKIQEGMDMGYEAANNPIELSFPVSEQMINP